MRATLTQSAVRTETSAWIGVALPRKEDERLLTGRGRYLDDLTPPGTLYLRFVRSPLAHGIIKGVHVGSFVPLPPGTTVIRAEDVPEHLGIRADTEHPTWQTSLQPVLARGKVRYAGEPVAAVLHRDPYVAEDAVDAVEVEYEELEPVVDLAKALDPRAVRVHEHWKDNVYIRRRRGSGDVAETRRKAYRVLRRVFRTHRQAAVPLEPRGVLAVPEADGSVTLWSSTQIPHLVRTYVAAQLGLPEYKVRVVAPDVGGGFGAKGHVFPEEVLLCWLALQVGRPIKWVEDRREHMLSCIHARDHLHVVEAHVSRHGELLGLRVQIVVDAGAYSVYPWTAGSDSGMAAKVMPGPYVLGAYDAEDIAVATNKCPLGTYRGVGRPSATFTMERLMDEIARELSLDPVEVRRRNVVRDFPHTTAVGLEYDAGSYLESLEKAVELLDLERLRARKGQSGQLAVGVGFAVYNEQTAHGTKDFAARRTPIESGYESVTVRIEADGSVQVLTGLQSHGQGMETTLAQVAAHELGLSPERVRVRHGDTAISPYTLGTWGSRGAVLGGGATAKACRMLLEKMKQIAAYHLQADPARIQPKDGFLVVEGEPERRVALSEVAYWANRRTVQLPPGLAPGLEATAFEDGPPSGAFSNACHAAVVEVDRETGAVYIRRFVVVEDCGFMLNPMVVDGQVHGGVAQGIGSALLEEFRYSEDGQPLSSTFAEYSMPTCREIPPIEVYHLHTPSPLTEYGMKGIGESGAIGPAAAVANAVSDALGVFIGEVPLRMERVWRAARGEQPPYLQWERWAGHPALCSFWDEREHGR